MLKFHHGLVAAITVTALSLCGTSVFAETESTKKDLTSYLCEDVVRFSGENRSIALALLHGYRLGKKNTTLFDTDVLSKASDDYIEYCIDHPNENALATFDKFTP